VILATDCDGADVKSCFFHLFQFVFLFYFSDDIDADDAPFSSPIF